MKEDRVISSIFESVWLVVEKRLLPLAQYIALLFGER